MSEKLKKGLVFAVVVLLLVLFARWLLDLFARVTSVERRQNETDRRLDHLRADMVTTISAVREENHQVARQIVDEVRVVAARPVGRKPAGQAGFAGTDPEAIY